ncbi:nicotinamide N-methyltransferase-like [Mizuhopecten yessoensis]|uniref:Nicotinamide N-methyltransferase n=1 Tax=Mizuhopecten yessoensis TaxID=6573 RepID=A0A210PDX0_MIZYE|nr:nicotinamide N-methyltransferase-like [Mizuhopecten yessoensis]OWF34651.1 Nicotinamide N-methyltransferase [Mizuhopecten yessoensis]
MEDLTETRDYANFDPYWYVEHFNATDEALIIMQTDLDNLHKIFTEYNIGGKRLLDVGTGPTIHSVISASRHVDEIFLSDYAPQNLEYLRKWLKKDISEPTKIIDYVISLEGCKMTAEERGNQVREKVRGILPIDVTSETPLGSAYDGGKFDVIISSYCIEAAVLDVTGYRRCIEHVSSLLNKGGVLINIGDLEGEYSQVGAYKFQGVSINKQEVQSAMAQAGYTIKLYSEFPVTVEEARYTDTNGYYIVVATK